MTPRRWVTDREFLTELEARLVTVEARREHEAEQLWERVLLGVLTADQQAQLAWSLGHRLPKI